MSTSQISIPLSKQKIAVKLLMASAFVGVGVWFLWSPPLIEHWLFGNPTVLVIVGLVTVLLFGLFAVFLARKLVDPAAGLLLSDDGFWDNSSGVAAGLVPWADIMELKVMQISRQKMILVVVRNPQVYIDRQTSSFKRRLMQANLTMYGTPVSLSPGTLAIDFDTLYGSLQQRLADRTN